jgi:hypothetical protein
MSQTRDAEAFVLIPGRSVESSGADLECRAVVLRFDRLVGPYAGMVHARGSTEAILLLATAAGSKASQICWVQHPVHEGTQGAT